MEKYILISEQNYKTFQKIVNEKLNDGYILYGAPFKSEYSMHQAMILDNTPNLKFSMNTED